MIPIKALVTEIITNILGLLSARITVSETDPIVVKIIENSIIRNICFVNISSNRNLFK